MNDSFYTNTMDDIHEFMVWYGCVHGSKSCWPGWSASRPASRIRRWCEAESAAALQGPENAAASSCNGLSSRGVYRSCLEDFMPEQLNINWRMFASLRKTNMNQYEPTIKTTDPIVFWCSLKPREAIDSHRLRSSRSRIPANYPYRDRQLSESMGILGNPVTSSDMGHGDPIMGPMGSWKKHN